MEEQFDSLYKLADHLKAKEDLEGLLLLQQVSKALKESNLRTLNSVRELLTKYNKKSTPC